MIHVFDTLPNPPFTFMSAYKNALHLSSVEQGPRLQLAAELLAEGRAVAMATVAQLPEGESRTDILCPVKRHEKDCSQIEYRRQINSSAS